MIYTVDRGNKTRTIVFWWNEDAQDRKGISQRKEWERQRKGFYWFVCKRDTKEKDGLAVIELETM